MDVYDLDGTIFKGNTFTLFTLWLFKHLLRSRSPMAAAQLLLLVVQRKLRRISHEEMKHRVVAIGSQVPAGAIEEFVTSVAISCRGRLDFLRATYGSTEVMVLATAAPDIYAKSLARALGFNHVISSGLRGQIYVETIRNRKRDEVLDLVRGVGGKVAVFFTDHIDDVSLARVAASVVLVDAEPETVAMMASQGIRAKTEYL